MDEEFPALNPSQYLKTYSKSERSSLVSTMPKTSTQSKGLQENATTKEPVRILNPEHELSSSGVTKDKTESLLTRNAVKLLLEGSLKAKVCRYCLNQAPRLSELDQILEVANNGSFYKIGIKDMVATFHPFKVADDPNFPNKICDKCLDHTIACYKFAQQCDRAERALRNCFEDVYDKLDKLDPLERPKKRGRQKLNPNFNIIQVENDKVIDYAEPVFHLINTCEPVSIGAPINDLECLKCCEVLPNLELLLNHMKAHPKSMWFNCRLCGRSFAKLNQLKKHFRVDHKHSPHTNPQGTMFNCEMCGINCENYYKYLQHIEKHKFKNVMEHLVEKKMDRLCSICLNQGGDMSTLDEIICLHGGCSELAGDRPLYSILASTLPEMNVLDNFTGSLICANCLNNAITAYIFINQTYFVRNRLNKCVSAMLDSLNKQQETNSNICIEIAEGSIMSGSEPAGGLFCAADDRDSSPPPPVDVLEDEFRLPDSADDSDSEAGPPTQPAQNLIHDIKQEPHTEIIAINGFVFNNTICSELLPPKKRKKWCGAKFTCTLCNKHFVSDYFLKRHILKHIPKKVECDVCSLQFQCKLYLYEHKKMVHLLKKAEFVFCKICGRCFTDERRLNYHQKRHNIRFCQLCDKLFRSQRCFDDHMQRHLYKIGTEMRKYRQNCSFCEKDCSNDNEFSLHVNKVHLQIKPYSCDMCERQFYTEYNLRSHQRLHSIYTREKCHLCNKVLSSRKLLVIHIRKHIGDTPFYCQICNQSFYSKSKAKKHMTLSHGGRFCCKFCKIALASKRALNDHVSFAHNSWI